MKLSANEAAKRTGKSVPTITRAIKSGKMSADRTESGGYQIDPAELFRVFSPVTKVSDETQTGLDDETKNITDETRLLREKMQLLEAALSDARQERDEWRDQAQRLAKALPAPTPTTERPRGWIARLLGPK